MELEGKKTIVLGAGKSGVAAAAFLKSRGAKVALHDIKPQAEWTDEARDLKADGVGLIDGELPMWLMDSIELCVVSPGVPSKSIPVRYMERAGAEVIGEVELAARFLHGNIVGITGSNGKTTTTALVGHLFKSAGHETLIGGNIGTPLISFVEAATDASWIVAELSSFQLETIKDFRPRIAAVLNVTPDHLDRYDSITDYAVAKHRIFTNQTPDDTAVLNAGDAVTASWAKGLRAEVVMFNTMFDENGEAAEGIYVKGREIVRRIQSSETILATNDDTQLVGRHNLENIAAAFAIGIAAGLDVKIMRESLRGFAPVEHRLELVARDEATGVRFYNDSKATNVDAAVKALEAFACETGRVVLIAGGRGKSAPYIPLAPLLKSHGRALVTIGEDAARIEAELRGIVETERAKDITDAVNRAAHFAHRDDIVLLAPACASFDMFAGYEARGRAFKEAVKNRIQKSEAGSQNKNEEHAPLILTPDS